MALNEYKTNIIKLVEERGIGTVASLYYDRIWDNGEKVVLCDYGCEIYEQKLFK
jgi:hypothetical protein